MPVTQRKAPQGLPDGMVVRSAIQFQPETLREDDRSVEFVLATELPARVWSWERWEPITEVLIAKGVVIPANKQVPLQDSHDRQSIKSTLGSVRDIRVEDYQVIGRLFFAKSAEAIDAFEKVRDGHVDSGSVGYSPVGTWIPDGVKEEYEGKEYVGPMQLTKKWYLGEYSLTAIGADPDAKARSAMETPQTAEQATEEVIPSQKADETIKENEDMPVETTTTNVDQPSVVDTEAIKRAAIDAERNRTSAITKLCNRHNMQDLATKLIDGETTIEKAQEIVLDEIANRQAPAVNGARVEMGETDVEKFRAAATDGLLIRAGVGADKPAAGASDFSRMGFKGLARECLRRQGNANVYRMSDLEVFETVIRAGMMGTSDFAYILEQTGAKSISRGFALARQTWKIWANKGSLPNLEAARRVNLDDAPEMLEVDEGGEIQHGTIGDKGELIQLATLARKIRITRRALLADDLSLFPKLFQKFGARAGVLIDAMAYGVLKANPNMDDGGALFQNAAARGYNLAATDAVVTASTVDIGYQRMMAQKASGGSQLDVIPSYLIVGPKNRVNAHVLTASIQDITATSNANGTSNAFADLQAITTPHLTQEWFLAADPTTADTVEVAFLDGKETPTMYATINDGDILGQTFIAYFDCGAAGIGFQGLFKNAGV